jgi:anti-sigma B factor antagonist
MSVEQYPGGGPPETLAIGTSRRHADYVIELAGELDLAGVTRFAEAVAGALDTDARTIVLDLSKLEFLDSTGVHAILKAERLLSAQHRSLVLVRGPRQVQRIFEIAGLADRLAFSDR